MPRYFLQTCPSKLFVCCGHKGFNNRICIKKAKSKEATKQFVNFTIPKKIGVWDVRVVQITMVAGPLKDVKTTEPVHQVDAIN